MNNTTYVKCENISVKELVSSIHDKVDKVAILSEDLSICICRKDDFNIYDPVVIGSLLVKEFSIRNNNLVIIV